MRLPILSPRYVRFDFIYFCVIAYSLYNFRILDNTLWFETFCGIYRFSLCLSLAVPLLVDILFYCPR